MRIVQYTYPATRRPAFAPGALARSPWFGLESEIDRLFASTLTDFVGQPANDLTFPVDLFEDQHHVHVRAELPGVSREDLGVELVEGVLNITATRRSPAAAEPSAAACSFSRSVAIPAEVRAEGISATYENGVLTVSLPKREEAKPRKINIAVK